MRAIWFEGVSDTARDVPNKVLQRWFTPASKADQEAFDRICHENFRAALDSIGPEAYRLPATPKDWAEEARQAPEIAQPFVAEIDGATAPETSASTALSLFLLLDQMSRNIFRGDQRRVYAHYDRISRALAHTMLQADAKRRWDLAYRHSFVPRSWFYMPLMHSEHIEDHRTLMGIYEEALEENRREGSDEGRAYIERQVKFEKLHADLVEKYGRYPHRNAVLGRQATAEEEEYLNREDAQTFGAG